MAQSDSTLPRNAIDHDLRAKRLDGLPTYPSREFTRDMYIIASVRSLLVTLVAVGVLVAVLLLFEIEPNEDRVHDHPEQFQLDLCASGDAMSGASSDVLDSVLRQRWIKQFEFPVKDAGSSAVRQPKLSYWNSAELYVHGVHFRRMLTLGALGTHPTGVHFELVNGSAACLDAVTLGFFLRNHLQKAGRYSLDTLMYGPLTIAQGLLVKNGDEGFFKPSKAQYVREELVAFKYWEYSLIVLTLALAGYGSVIALISVYSFWHKTMVDWIAQYDYLWEVEWLRQGSASDAEHSFKERLSSAFWIMSVVSPLFSIDNLIGDVWTVSGSWPKALLSSFLHGLICFVAPVGFLVIPAYFETRLRPWVSGFLWALTLSGVPFATLFNFAVPYTARLPVFCVFQLSLLVFAIGNLLYLCVLVLYALARTVAAPDETISYAAPFITIVLYIVGVIAALQGFREKLQNMSATKARLMQNLYATGLTYDQIVLATFKGVVVLLIIAFFLGLTAVMYQKVGDNDPIAAFTAPVVAIASFVQKTINSQKVVEEQIKNTAGTVLDVVHQTHQIAEQGVGIVASKGEQGPVPEESPPAASVGEISAVGR